MTTVRRQFRHLIRVVDDVLDATRLSSNKIEVRPARVDLVPIGLPGMPPKRCVPRSKPPVTPSPSTCPTARCGSTPTPTVWRRW